VGLIAAACSGDTFEVLGALAACGVRTWTSGRRPQG